MDQNLLIGLLGNKNSGRSYTWKQMFGKRVITGKNLRRLYLTDNEYAEVFLINGSPLERKKDVQQIIKPENPRIVLCSFLYSKGIEKVLEYFVSNNYYIYLHWLNPGFNDKDNKSLFYDT